MRKSFIIILGAFLVSFSGIANIKTIKDIQDGSVSIQTYDRETLWAGVHFFYFVKDIAKDGQKTYYFKIIITGRGSQDLIFGNKAELKINDVNYFINIADNVCSKYNDPVTGMITRFYDVPKDILPLMKNCNQLAMTLTFDNRMSISFEFSARVLDEIMEIIDLT